MNNEENLTKDKPQKSQDLASDEIDVIGLLKTLWKGRKIVLGCVVIFTLIGIYSAVTKSNVYTVSTIMVPQGQAKSGSLSGLGGFAALAGIDLSNMNSASQDLSPLVYPEIVKSYPFQKAIIHTPLKWNSLKEPMSMVGYSKRTNKPNALGIIKKYTIGLPGVVMSLFRKGSESSPVITEDSLFNLTPDERALCNSLTNRLFLTVDNRNGYMTLTATGPEPMVTAQIAEYATKLLQERIIEYRTNKASQNLAFMKQLYREKKTEFETAQDRLARFQDRNLNMSSNMARTDEDRLHSEYQLAFSVYSEVAKQLETAKIRVKEDTPIFSIIQPVTVPLEKSKPNRSKIVMVFFLIGGIIGICLVFLDKLRKVFTKKWRDQGAHAIQV